MLVFDLDGTLLNDDKRITDYTIKVLKECKKQGCKIVINTARSLRRTIKYADIIEADYIVCFSGNYVCDRNGNTISDKSISFNVAKKIKDILNNNYVCEYFDFSVTNNKDFVERFDSSYDTELIDNLSAYKFIVKLSKDNLMDLKNSNIYKKILLEATCDNIYRIYPSGTDKWNGILSILKYEKKTYKIISFGDDLSDYKMLKESYIGVRMGNSINGLELATKFKTSSNNKNGVASFLIDYFELKKEISLKNIEVLDCSLRDGGHLNDSKFGIDFIKRYIGKLACANIDIIEFGFLEDGDHNEDVAKFETIESVTNVLKNIDIDKSKLSLMLQADKYDINKLSKNNGLIDIVRVSFHKEYLEKGIEYCKKVKELGYKCSVNPINFANYTNGEIVDLLNQINLINPDYFCLVDTFGLLTLTKYERLINLIDSFLDDNIAFGIHLHNNLESAFVFSQKLIDRISANRKIIIDSCVEGYGRAPGNLKTELLLYYLNTLHDKERYNMDFIYSIMENENKILRSKYDWSLDFRYSISAFLKTHRTYAEYLKLNNLNFKECEKKIKEIPILNKEKYRVEVIKTILGG